MRSATAAKEILGLVDDGKMQFDQIGVVARSLEAYGPTIKEVFHNITSRSPAPSRNR